MTLLFAEIIQANCFSATAAIVIADFSSTFFLRDIIISPLYLRKADWKNSLEGTCVKILREATVKSEFFLVETSFIVQRKWKIVYQSNVAQLLILLACSPIQTLFLNRKF